MNNFFKELGKLKEKIWKDIELDHKIKADPYDNVARAKICEKVEKLYLKTRR